MYHCIISYDKLWLAIIYYYTINHYWESFIYKCINWYIILQKKLFNHQNYVIPCKESCHILWATGPPGQSLVVVAQLDGPPLFCGPLRWATVKLGQETLGHRATRSNPCICGPACWATFVLWPPWLGHLKNSLLKRTKGVRWSKP